MQGGTIRIEVGFKFNANLQQVTDQNPPFTLDDPVLGELDVAELPGGDVWIDISQYFIDGLSISRGRNRAVDLFTAGTARFRLDNRDRTFDPTNTSGPFFGNLTPMRPVRISAIIEGTEVRLFVGFVTDWTSMYERPTDAWVDVDCVDAFILFAADTLPAVSPVGDGEKAGQRIDRLLTATNFGPQRNLSEGIYPLAETEFDGNLLALMQESAASDFGLLFVARDGTVTYRTPFDIIVNSLPTVTFVQQNVMVPGVRYHDIELSTSAELLYNIVNVTWDGGTKVVQDVLSVDEYLPRTLSLRTSLKNEADAESLGDFVLSQYAEPKPRFRQIAVKMHDRRLSQTDRISVASLDIGDVVTAVRRAPGQGTPEVVVLDIPVEGVQWRFTRDGWSGAFALGDPLPDFIATIGIGGDVATDEVDGRLYRFHTFTENGTFSIGAIGTDDELEVLVVGGGGGGSTESVGGGGGGGRVVPLSFAAELGEYAVVVGSGGAASPDAGSGVASTIETPAAVIYTAPGGGGGRRVSNGFSGGSGGGAGGDSSSKLGGSDVAGTPTAGFGSAGGNNFGSNTPLFRAGGGGGGADGAGGNGASSTGGNGGDGRVMDIDGNRYGAGGAGSAAAVGTPGAGQGVANTGSGGNAGDGSVPNRNGTAGVVIFRYPIEAELS